MKPLKVARKQQIAVFGESGSGKTALLLAFYGTAQKRALSEDSPFDVLADDPAQGRRLHQNYLGMKTSATLPMTNRSTATRFAFLIKRRPDDQKVLPNEAEIAREAQSLAFQLAAVRIVNDRNDLDSDFTRFALGGLRVRESAGSSRGSNTCGT
jgi:ABC-type dipeptide/oligopeptide/nickel transport system ATPase component